MIGPVGKTDPPAGSAVMLKCEGRVEPAMVKAAWPGAAPNKPSEIGWFPSIAHSWYVRPLSRAGSVDETR